MYYLLSPLINAVIPPITAPNPLGKGLIDYRSILFAAFIIPAIVGFITGILPQATWFQKLFRGKLLHPTPTAWDFIFGDRTKSYLIMFHLKSGAKIGGLYSNNGKHPGKNKLSHQGTVNPFLDGTAYAEATAFVVPPHFGITIP